MDKNISKKDLLKLKDSKPVPITAHSHEIIIPVCYTSKVKKFLDKEGIKLPLSKEKLAALRKKARETEGNIKDIEDDENSYAKGTTNLKQSQQQQNISKITIYNAPRPQRRRKRKGKAKLRTTSGLINIPEQQRVLDNLPKPSSFSLIRPIYPANTPIIDYKKSLDESVKKEKEAIEKRQKEIEDESKKSSSKIDQLEKNLEEERKKSQAIINSLLTFRIPHPTPYHFPTSSTSYSSSSSSSSSGIKYVIPDSEEEEAGNEPEQEQPQRAAQPAHSIPALFSKKFLNEIFQEIPLQQRPIIVGQRTQLKLYDTIRDFNPEILDFISGEYSKMESAGQKKVSWYKKQLLNAMKDRFFK